MQNDRITQYMVEAIALAREAEALDEVPVGALLVHEGKIIGRGKNLREQTHRTIAHAEIMALDDYSKATRQWRLPAHTALIVTAEPCLMCTGALLWARVSEIYFGCSDTRNAGLLRVAPLIEAGVYDHKFKKVEGGVLAEECGELLSGYFKKKRLGNQ